MKIAEIFPSIQGEGRHAGRAALFIRLPGCNLKCPFCDTKHKPKLDITERNILDMMGGYPYGFAVITGGEPLINPDFPDLVKLITGQGWKVAVETNGTAPMPPDVQNVYVSCSPKRASFIDGERMEYFISPSLWCFIDEFRYCVDRHFDFTVLDRHEYKGEYIAYYLSPEYSEMKRNVQRIRAFQKRDPSWKLSVQIHKWLQIP